jgi:flagellar biosynthesis protein FlhB
MNVFYIAFYETTVTFVIGIVTMYLALQVARRLILRQSYSRILTEPNYAAVLFSASYVFCVMLLVQNSITPAVDALRTLVSAQAMFSVKFFGVSLLYLLIIFLISVCAALFLTLVSAKILIAATEKIDEVVEIKKGNLAAAILLSTCMPAFTLFIRPSYERFAASLVSHEMLDRLAPKLVSPDEPDPRRSTLPQPPLRPSDEN